MSNGIGLRNLSKVDLVHVLQNLSELLECYPPMGVSQMKKEQLIAHARIYRDNVLMSHPALQNHMDYMSWGSLSAIGRNDLARLKKWRYSE